MKTYQLTRGAGIDGLELRDLPPRALDPHEVRVGVRAVALNFRDLLIAGADVAGDPITPGSDGAGEVVEVGSAVTRWRPGDRVLATFFPDWIDGPPAPHKTGRALGGRAGGVLAQQIVVGEQALVRMPARWDFCEAATLPCAGVTAWNGLFVAGASRPGDTVLLLGTGGVSIWALQLAKAAGLRVIITSSDDRKLQAARGLGADATINYRDTPDWAQRARALTDGRGVDLVLDTAGRETLAQSMRALRPGGTLAYVGGTTGFGGEIDADALIDGALRVVGVLVGSRTLVEDLVRFVEQRGLRPVIDRCFDFGDLRAAYAHLASQRHLGKVVVAVAAPSTEASPHATEVAAA